MFNYIKNICLILCLFSLNISLAQILSSNNDSAPATVSYSNRDIIILQATILDATPKIRAQRVVDRLNAIPLTQLNKPLSISPLVYKGKECATIESNGKQILTLCSDDLDIGSPPFSQVVKEVSKNIHEAMLARYEQNSLKRMLWALALSLIATFILIVLILLIRRVNKRIYLYLNKQIEKNSHLPAISWRNILPRSEFFIVKISSWFVIVFLLYFWLAFVLLRFPYTRHWGEQLGKLILNFGNIFLDSILQAVPGLIRVAVILFMTRLIVRLFNILFDSVQQGYTVLPGLHSETVGATRRLTQVVLWVFALILSYPYLPGANSDAFKGVSVFLGLMLTLGSAGLVNQAMSGLVLIYSRALKVGDRVKIGETEGVVIEQGALSTKLRNRYNQEVTLPNSVVVGGKILNSTRLARKSGEIVITNVTIGYDTPWRQVHAMLELAVHRVPELRQDEAIKIYQISLNDFYVQYELSAHINGLIEPFSIRSKLHAAIQDVFNEFKVQIMSPNFVAQPENSVISPPEKWYEQPAKSPINNK